jgi:hypothetical protein
VGHLSFFRLVQLHWKGGDFNTSLIGGRCCGKYSAHEVSRTVVAALSKSIDHRLAINMSSTLSNQKLSMMVPVGSDTT